MVRSRSETNLNRIFIDLCTSPALRSKYDHQSNTPRQTHLGLPTLLPIKSNSCSNMDPSLLTSTNVSSRSSLENDQTEHMNTSDEKMTESTPVSDEPNTKPRERSSVSLAPMESTGFTVQTTTTDPIEKAAKLFETLNLNQTETRLSNNEPPRDVEKRAFSLPFRSSLVPKEWKQQDFLNRLQNRLKSRKHLRRFFLS